MEGHKTQGTNWPVEWPENRETAAAAARPVGGVGGVGAGCNCRRSAKVKGMKQSDQLIIRPGHSRASQKGGAVRG